MEVGAAMVSLNSGGIGMRRDSRTGITFGTSFGEDLEVDEGTTIESDGEGGFGCGFVDQLRKHESEEVGGKEARPIRGPVFEKSSGQDDGRGK